MQDIRRNLTLFDSICIIVGIIVGVGIFETAPLVAKNIGSFSELIGVWLLGGLLTLTGALTYAVLGKKFPEEGGEYVYLKEAYGNWAGFLFAWTQAIIVRPGSIAAMSFPFARYAKNILVSGGYVAAETDVTLVLAGGCVVFLTAVNLLGLREGKAIQNVLTVLKYLGLLVLVIGGLLLSRWSTSIGVAEAPRGDIYLAAILVLFTYGGWNEIAYVAGEVKDPQRNILRALMWGTGLVTTIYVGFAVAMAFTLGGSINSSRAPAADAAEILFGAGSGLWVSVLITVSCLGAINGLLITGSRIYYVLGESFAPFKALSGWSSESGVPVRALLVQSVLSLVIVVLGKSFEGVVVYTTAVVWLFFLATGASLFVFYFRDKANAIKQVALPQLLTALVFCVSCIYLIYSAIRYDAVGTVISLCIAAAGAAVYGAHFKLNLLGMRDKVS